MGRQRRLIAPCDDALRALIVWMHAVLDEQMLSQAQLARDLSYHPSSISRALSGQCLPPWRMIEQMSAKYGASDETARTLWEAAKAIRQSHRARVSDGYPPPTSTVARSSSSRCVPWWTGEGSRSGSWSSETRPGCCAPQPSVPSCACSGPRGVTSRSRSCVPVVCLTRQSTTGPLPGTTWSGRTGWQRNSSNG